MDPLLTILKRLLDHRVALVMVGGMAAVFHGSDVVTQDIDFCVPFTPENMERLLEALRDVKPTFRQRPDRLPLWDDPVRLATLNVMLVETTLGHVDFLREISGVGHYADVLARSIEVELAEGIVCRMIDLDGLIAAKRAANRPKDREALRALEVIRQAPFLSAPPPPAPPKTPD